MAVSTVSEIGADVSRFRVGDRVFGHIPIRETQTVDDSAVELLANRRDPALAWLANGRIRTEGAIKSIVPFEELPKPTGPSTNARRSRSRWAFALERCGCRRLASGPGHDRLLAAPSGQPS